MTTSFALFGTLVDIDRPTDPSILVAEELRERGVAVPSDFADAYRERHIDAPDGAEVPLPAHVAAVLSSRGVDPADNVIRRAVVSAFDPTTVETRDGTVAAVDAAAEHGSVGVLANSRAPEVVRRALRRSALAFDAFDTVVTSIGCGWRKPHPNAFETLARRLDVDSTDLLHVGDDPATDGGARAVGADVVLVGDVPLTDLPSLLDDR